MFSKVMRRALVPLVGLTVAVGGLSAPVWAAGEDKGLCNENHDRVTIPDSFPLDACFDGETLILKNNTEFPLGLTLVGDDVSKPERYTKAGEAAGRFLDYIQPATFDRQPQINGPHFRSGVVPPKYYIKVRVGKGEVKVKSDVTNVDTQQMYALAKTVWEYMPSEAVTDVIKAGAQLVRELKDVGDQHEACMDRNNNWGDLGCSALKSRNVTYAYGRAAVNGLGKGVVTSVTSLFDTAVWSDNAVGDRLDIAKAKKEFKITAVKAPDPPKDNPQPPQNNNPGGNNGGSSGDSGGNNGGGNNNPPPQDPKPEPKPVIATVQNKHLAGSGGLEEDSTPSYLSTSPQPRCASNGCKIGGTDMWSGDTLVAGCWFDGSEMTNENRNTSADDNNPHKLTTTRWLKGKRNGQEGVISYIYLSPGSRDLVGHC